MATTGDTRMPKSTSTLVHVQLAAVRRLASIALEMFVLAARKSDEVDQRDRRIETLEIELWYRADDVIDLGQRMRGDRVYRP